MAWALGTACDYCMAAKTQTARNAGPLRYAKARFLFLAQPGLAAAEQRETHVAADFEFLAVVAGRHLCRIHLAVVRIEDLAVFPRAAFLLQPPGDDQAFDRLVVVLALAGVAQRVRALV